MVLVAGLMGCITEKDFHTPEGFVIPGRVAFDFDYYENRCELTTNTSPKALQDLFNLYGHHGWRLSGMSATPQGLLFCMNR